MFSARIKKFLTQMIKFLELFTHDFRKVELRIKQEEKFLNKANRNEEYFKDFIECWREEVNSNKKLMKHFNKILKANPKVIRNLRAVDYGILTGTVAIGAVAASLDPGLPRNIALGMALVSALAATVLILRSISRPDLLNTQKDKQILKHIKKLTK